MSEATTIEAAPETRRGPRRRSELGVCALLLALGVVVGVDGLSMATDFTQRGPVGPRAMPVLVGALLVLTAVLLAVDVLRGGHGESETGEDIDLAAPADWGTVLRLAAAFLVNAALINVVGFPISGALLFWGAAHALGSRSPVRDPLIAAALSTASWFVFNELLGVSMPGGPLMGVL